MKLEDYKLTYEVTQMPLILYAAITNVLEPLDFEDFTVPSECKVKPIECRFAIYKPSGELEDMKQHFIPCIHPSAVIAVLHNVPLGMLKELFTKLRV